MFISTDNVAFRRALISAREKKSCLEANFKEINHANGVLHNLREEKRPNSGRPIIFLFFFH